MITDQISAEIVSALRDVHRLVARRAGTDAVIRAFDAVAALPSAQDPAPAQLIAAERSVALACYPEELPDDATDTVPVEVAEAVRYTHALKRLGWPADVVFEVLDEAEALPEAAGWAPTLAYDRVMVGHMYDLPEDAMEELLRHALNVHGDAPTWLLVGTISNAAGRHPALAVQYLLPELLDQAECELRDRPDPDGEHAVAAARRHLERARVERGT